MYIGAQVYTQGRFDGVTRIGNHVWIGPQVYFDARSLIIEDHVGWGPGSKVLGSAHTGLPIEVPIIETDLEIRPVHVQAWADIGTGSIILPGVTIGKGSIVGAGAIVTHNVPTFAIVAGVPGKFLLVAILAGAKPDARIVPFRGEYYELNISRRTRC